MSYTISITSVGAGISSIHWMRYGNNSMGVEVMFEDGYLYQGGSLSKTADSGYLKLDVTTQSGYSNPTFYRTSPSYYEQNLNDDKIISFNADKSGYILASATYGSIYFQANGGTGAPSTILNQVAGTTISLPTTIPTRTGFTFMGWSTSDTATYATWAAGGNFTVPAGATVLYAVWGITLSFDGQGATSGVPGSQTKGIGSGSNATFTISSSVPVKSGYTFAHWLQYRDDDSTATYAPGASITLYSNTTLYAQFTVTTYSVAVSLGAHVAQANLTYTNSAGTSVTTTISTATTLTVKGGSSITVNTALTTDNRCYVSDMVYYTAGISTVGVSIGTAYQISQSQSLEVRSKVIQYTLHYDLNGGSAGSNDFSDKPVAVETSGDNIGKAVFTLSEDTPTAPDSEYVFSSWSYNQTIYLPGRTLIASGNVTVTASYLPKTFEVHFEVKSGIGYVTIEWTNVAGETVTRAFSPSDYTTTNIAAKSGTNVAITVTLANNRWKNATISYFSGSAKTEAQRITTVSSGGAKIVTSEMWADIEAERVTVSAFTYHGSDGTDNYYFRTNLSVTSAVTAESMERMGTVCQSIAILNRITWGGWPTITQGAIIHASEFNAILNRLAAMQAQLQQLGYSPAYLPDNVIGLSTMTEGQIPTVITPELFIGETSIKNCVNAMIQFTNQRA